MTYNTYPDVSWPVFDVCNRDRTGDFEDMTRRLFAKHFAGGQTLHSENMNPGIEVLPVLEPVHTDGTPQRWISFQSKYFDGSVGYSKILDSAKKTIKYYKGKLDLIYLFSNKTITTTTKNYQTTEQLLSEAGIVIIPITNKELLDLVVLYPEIANYYFRNRTIPSFSTPYIPEIAIDNTTGVITITPLAISSQTIDKELLIELIKEKVQICRKHILSLELEELKMELDRLQPYDMHGIDGSNTLGFYSFLLNLHEGKEVEDNQTCAEASWLKAFYAEPKELTIEEFKQHTDEVQVFIIEKLFVSQKWRNIVELHDQCAAYDTIQMQMDLHYGLSLFNLHAYDEASEVLHKVYQETQIPLHHMFTVFADIQKENSKYRNGMCGDSDNLARLLANLDSFKNIKQYQSSELLIAALRMESEYNLGMNDKAFLENAISEYDSFSYQVKSNTIIRYYLGICLELNGERDKAIDLYQKMEWKTDDTIAERYMICLILSGHADAACEAYNALSEKAKNIRTLSVYLFALSNNHDTGYSATLLAACNEYRHDIESLIHIAYFVEDESAAKEIIVPIFKDTIFNTNLDHLLFYQKVELLTFLAHHRQIRLLERVLKSVNELEQVNFFVLGEIYKALFETCNNPGVFSKNRFDISEEALSAERIADRFIDVDVSKKNFLQIKVICVSAKRIPFSMLKYSKELFDFTHDESIARNIISLLLDRNDKDYANYEPYVEALIHSEIPEHCIAVASAYLITGQEELAESYSYKALYLLNGEDNYEVYRAYFGLCGYKLRWVKDGEPMHSSRGNVVVTMECIDKSADGSNDTNWTVCLDSETDFTFNSNKSIGLEHLNPSSTDYLKIRTAGINQIIRVGEKRYQVKQIIPRSQQCFGFVIRKIHEKPEKFPGMILSLSTDNPEEMVEQIRSLTDRTKQSEALLESYHFVDGELGLPIESVGFNEYDRYLLVLKYLLYAPDQAFYSGEFIVNYEQGHKYVPTLSTLALLSILNRMDVFDEIKSSMIIPESYISFFKEQYEKSLSDRANDTKMLSFANGKPVLFGPDETAPEVWERILHLCNDSIITSVSDQERISFPICDGLSGERFITGLRLHTIQLDALILAKREDSYYLCDDLFFRKVANWIGIRHLNMSSILLQHKDSDYKVKTIMELSKTNYIYVPLMGRSDEEIQKLYNNLLSGEKKKELNTEWIQRNYAAIERVIREFFGDDYADRIISEISDQT